MYQVVQVQCPRCQKVLRAPVEWVAQPMRCKFCKQVFQSRQPQLQSALANAITATAPASYSPSDNLFDNLENLDGPAASPAPRRPRSAFLKKLIGMLVLLAVGAGLAVGGIKLLQEKEPATKVAEEKGKKGKLIASNEDKKHTPDDPPRNKKKEESPKNLPNETRPKLDADKKDTPAEKDPPKKDPGKKKNDNKKKDPPKDNNDPFPRRALLINVNDYLYWNPVAYGSKYEPREPVYPGSSSGALAYLLNRSVFHVPEDQITELSDGVPEGAAAGKSRPTAPWKQVIENTLTDFLSTSRAQDQIIVSFAGHAIDVDKGSYLVPLEGKKEDPDTLIPISWVYDQLSKCRAKQKLLILDVCRFPPARGLERPAPGEMSEQMDKVLAEPPLGVQVWCSCTKGQQSIELEKGSVFVQSFCDAVRKEVITTDIQEAGHPLPLELLVPKVNQRIAKIVGTQKLQQISRLSGKEAPGGAPYNKAEPMPPPVVVHSTKMESADLAVLEGIRKEINLLPPTRGHQSPVHFFPPLASKTLTNYKADYISWTEIDDLKKDEKKAEKFPLRKAIVDAIDAMKEGNLVLQERLIAPGGTFDAKAKAGFLEKQKNPGLIIFQLQTALDQLKAAEKDRETETKRFQAHYDFTMARIQSRLIYVYEYNFLLGQIRADNLPPLEPIHNGWRLGSAPKVAVMAKEAKVKDMVKTVGKAWKHILQEHPGTPWAVLATREQMTALGLEWRPTRD